jgi:hypothetical protein
MTTKITVRKDTQDILSAHWNSEVCPLHKYTHPKFLGWQPKLFSVRNNRVLGYWIKYKSINFFSLKWILISECLWIKIQTAWFYQLNEGWITECPGTEFIYISYNRFWTRVKDAEHVIKITTIIIIKIKCQTHFTYKLKELLTLDVTYARIMPWLCDTGMLASKKWRVDDIEEDRDWHYCFQNIHCFGQEILICRDVIELRFVNSEAWRDEIVDQLLWTGAQIIRVLRMAYDTYRIL